MLLGEVIGPGGTAPACQPGGINVMPSQCCHTDCGKHVGLFRIYPECFFTRVDWTEDKFKPAQSYML